MQEESVKQQEGERDISGDELKYEEGFDENEYTEELVDDFEAMITVEYGHGDDCNCLDVSEVAVLAGEECFKNFSPLQTTFLFPYRPAP